jgi:thioredoxin-like negative regulator of GroEL
MRTLLLWLALCGLATADELLVVTRQGCPPCAKLKRDLVRNPDMTKGHTIALVEGAQAMADHGVDLVPTVIRLRHGREVARRVGYSRPSDITEWIKAHD